MKNKIHPTEANFTEVELKRVRYLLNEFINTINFDVSKMFSKPTILIPKNEIEKYCQDQGITPNDLIELHKHYKIN